MIAQPIDVERESPIATDPHRSDSEKTERLKDFYRFEVDGRKFVFDVGDIYVLEVDDAVWNLYGAAEENPDCPPAEHAARLFDSGTAADVLGDLRRLGLLTRSPRASIPPPPPPDSVPYMGVTLNVSHGCNLKCSYCFANQGDYGTGVSFMNALTAKRAIDWLLQRNPSGKSARIGFFGGEPMLNLKTIKAAVDYAKTSLASDDKDVRFHITTNGTLLTDDSVEWLAKEKNIDVQISLDGVAEVHDKQRPFTNGRGSHAAVAAGVRRLKAATGKAGVRGTIGATNPHFAPSLRHAAEDLGGTMVAFEPASGPSDQGQAMDAQALSKIKAEWDLIAEWFEAEARQGRLQPVDNLLSFLRKIDVRKKSVFGCTVGRGSIAIDPRGDIYPCHRFVGDAHWRMGNVLEGTFDSSKGDVFTQNTVDRRAACRVCWARYLCGGRCAHEALEATGNIADPDPLRCDLFRHQAKIALRLYVRLKPLEHLFKKPLEAE